MKNKSQLNEKIEAITLRTLVVGIDIAKEKQWARFVDCRGVECGKAMYFRNDGAGFEAILARMRQISKENSFADVIVGMETNRPLLESAGELFDEAGRHPCCVG